MNTEKDQSTEIDYAKKLAKLIAKGRPRIKRNTGSFYGKQVQIVKMPNGKHKVIYHLPRPTDANIRGKGAMMKYEAQQAAQ